VALENEPVCESGLDKPYSAFSGKEYQSMEIVIMHCYETVLKSNNFKKHVFTSATDQSMSRIALYEYLGTYDLPSTDKVRTNPKVIQQIKEDHRKPKEIFLQMNLNNSVEAPKDTRQINQRLSRACIVHLVIKRTNWSYVKTMSCSGSHLGIPINIKNTKFVKDLPMIDAQIRFNQCNSFREENISVFSHMVLC
jgi:hypothetical protein